MTHQLLHSSQMSGFCTSAANCWLNCCLECTLSTCRFNLSLRPKLKQIADNCFQHFLPFYLYLGLILSWRQNIFASKSDSFFFRGTFKIDSCVLTWCCIVCRRKVFLWGGHFYSDGSCDPAVWRCNHRFCKSSSLYPPRCGHWRKLFSGEGGRALPPFGQYLLLYICPPNWVHCNIVKVRLHWVFKLFALFYQKMEGKDSVLPLQGSKRPFRPNSL